MTSKQQTIADLFVLVGGVLTPMSDYLPDGAKLICFETMEDKESWMVLTKFGINFQYADGSFTVGNRIVDLSRKFMDDEQLQELVPHLAKISDLKELNLRRNRLTDVQPLAQLRSLELLYLDHNEHLRDLVPLSSLTELKYLSFRSCQVEDLSPLAHLNALLKLDIAHNYRTLSLAALSALPMLSYLDVGSYYEMDMSSLGGLIHLQTIRVYRHSAECQYVLDVMNYTGPAEIDYNPCPDYLNK